MLPPCKSARSALACLLCDPHPAMQQRGVVRIVQGSPLGLEIRVSISWSLQDIFGAQGFVLDTCGALRRFHSPVTPSWRAVYSRNLLQPRSCLHVASCMACDPSAQRHQSAKVRVGMQVRGNRTAQPLAMTTNTGRAGVGSDARHARLPARAASSAHGRTSGTGRHAEHGGRSGVIQGSPLGPAIGVWTSESGEGI